MTKCSTLIGWLSAHPSVNRCLHLLWQPHDFVFCRITTRVYTNAEIVETPAAAAARRYIRFSLCGCEVFFLVAFGIHQSIVHNSTPSQRSIFKMVQQQQQQRKRSLQCRAASVALVLACSVADVNAWSASPKTFRTRRSHDPLVIPTHPSPAPHSPVTTTTTSRKMLKNPGNPRVKNPKSSSSRSTKLELSQCVLASCDTLPSFRTAHGLLSPETVLRLEERNKGDENKALASFLRTYRRSGPLSCVPMLSDPDVLPHLTMAMREIAL